MAHFISFKPYPHWGGSKLAQITNGYVLIIKRLLRHKSIQNTMKYIHTIEFKEEVYDETVATTPVNSVVKGDQAAAPTGLL